MAFFVLYVTVKIMFNEIDLDGSGSLESNEMAELDVCRAILASDVADYEDLDDELEEAARECGEALIREADSNGDGVVNFNEYMAWWTTQKQKQLSGKARQQKEQHVESRTAGAEEEVPTAPPPAGFEWGGTY